MPGAGFPDAVIFDFNGTLSDDEPLLYELFSAMFAERLGWSMTRREYAQGLAGLSDREIIVRALARSGRPVAVEDLLSERSDRYRDLVSGRSPVREETRALVRRLVELGLRLAIVTGAQRADVDLVLADVPEARSFEVVVTAEDVTHGKPHPEGFLRAASELGVEPGRALVLEDSVAGVRGAQAAGMAVIGVAGGMQGRARLQDQGVEVVSRLSPSLLERSPFAG
jgi:HAD superfamily hydrolase (TIGR01509 family)